MVEAAFATKRHVRLGLPVSGIQDRRGDNRDRSPGNRVDLSGSLNCRE
jgi:hypothetical protein